MINNEYQTIGLYEHNADSYNTVKDTYDSGEDIVGIVHATGTGKSYNALQLSYDNNDKKILYVVPSNGIIEHIKNIIDSNPNLDMERDFPNLEFRTYQSFISLSTEEIKDIDCDLLILDEFHHIGAPVWGSRINTLIETHPDIKVFGMTAYTVRDRGTSYERDMANPDADELFSGKIVSRYDLCDAMIDGVLPKPIYKSAYTNLIGFERNLEERVQKLDATPNEYKEYMKILSDVKKRIHEAPSIPNILKKSIKPNGKYIYFCPPLSEDGTNDIETIKKQAMEWLKNVTDEENIVIYTSTSDMGKEGKLNRESFYDDVNLDGEKVDNKLRIMFAINQYNEGIHAPNIDGVIMGRGTTSDIVYFEQLGRALSVRGNTKEKFDELEKYSIEELTLMCKSKDIPVKENTSKEELIEKLIAPVVIDLANNYEFIKELENNLKDRIKDIQTNGLGNHRDIKINDASFDIEIENQNLFEMLMYVCDKLTDKWEIKYNYAKKYYEHYGNLLIPYNFITSDGYAYDKNGSINLGNWITNQRTVYNKGKLSPERKQLLDSIGMVYNKYDVEWLEKYEYAKKYYEHYGNLLIPYNFITSDGYTYDKKGSINLGNWITNQRFAYNKGELSLERKQLLDSIKMVYRVNNDEWQKKYNYVKKYYEHHGNLLISQDFTTNDGYTYDKNGSINLGMWISAQRQLYSSGKLSPERKQLLDSIGMVYNKYDVEWQKKYEYAKKYYEHHGNLLIPYGFTTNDGYTYDENGNINLGLWISIQRKEFNTGKLFSKRQSLLNAIGMIYDYDELEERWQKYFNYARIYYEHHGDLLIPHNFITSDGYTYNEKGSINLGSWLSDQKKKYKKGKLSQKRKELLDEIGMDWEPIKKVIPFEIMYNYARIYYEYHGNLDVPSKFRTNDGYTYDKNGTVRLGQWITNQRNLTPPESERGILLTKIGMVWRVKRNQEDVINICLEYNIDMVKNKGIIEHISIQELKSKIEFLKVYNMKLIDENGLLSDIFSMSSIDMKEKYNVSLEELINNYYVKEGQGKGV